MPLDDTRGARASPKVAANPPSRARSPVARTERSSNDAHADARAELDRTLAALLSRAKTPKSRAVLAYWASSLACSQDEAWRGSAKKALVASNVLPDYTANPLPVGTVATIYSDPLVVLAVKVVPQASRLNVDAAFAELAAAGVKPALLRRVRKRHTTHFSGAHIITPLLTE